MMKTIKHTFRNFFLLFLTIIALTGFSQAFKQGAFLISASGGSVKAYYNTNNYNPIANDVSITQPQTKNSFMEGIRDPLFIEYGITNRIGIGIMAGGDVWKVDALKFYNINMPNNSVNLKTSELTFDVAYHTYVSNRIDWSVYSSFGYYEASFDDKQNESDYKYRGIGYIYRAGTSVRYYIFKRFAIMGLVSHFNSVGKPMANDIEHNNLDRPYTTSIKGWAIEWGFSLRFGSYIWRPKKLDFQQE